MIRFVLQKARSETTDQSLHEAMLHIKCGHATERNRATRHDSYSITNGGEAGMVIYSSPPMTMDILWSITQTQPLSDLPRVCVLCKVPHSNISAQNAAPHVTPYLTSMHLSISSSLCNLIILRTYFANLFCERCNPIISHLMSCSVPPKTHSATSQVTSQHRLFICCSSMVKREMFREQTVFG